MLKSKEVNESNAAGLRRSSFAAYAAAIALVFSVTLGPSTVSAANPPTPQNFRVTARTAYTVSLAWSQGSGGSGNFSYHLSGAYGVTPVVLPSTATSYTFTALFPGNQYWFFIYARDAAGRTSGQASVSTTTLLDTTPPSTAPVVSPTEIGSNYASLSWTPAQDDGPYLFYEVWVNGSLHSQYVEKRYLDHPPVSPAKEYLHSHGPGLRLRK